MKALYLLLFYQPLLNLLIWLYNALPGHSLALAIVLLTVLLRLVLYPLSGKSIRAQRALQALQPKVEALKAQHKDRQDLLGQEMIKLYKQEKVSPFSSCLPLLIQLPFLIALYQVFNDGLTSAKFDRLYPFIANPGAIDTMTFGLNLAQPSLVLAVLAGAAQFWQAKMLMAKQPAIKAPESKDEGMAAAMNRNMLYLMPLVTVYLGWKWPGGLSLYWLVSTLLTVAQQYVVFRKPTQVVDGSQVKAET